MLARTIGDREAFQLATSEDKSDFIIAPDPHAPHRFESLKKMVAKYKGQYAMV